MQIICLKVGEMGTNCYLAADGETKQTLIIDPGDESDYISSTILENKLIPQAILLTHGHYDHCLAVLDLKLNFNIPIYLHPKDLFLYQNIFKSASFWSSNKSTVVVPAKAGTHPVNSKLSPPPIDHFLADRGIISFGTSSLQVLHTPGHTPGSVCFTSVKNHTSHSGLDPESISVNSNLKSNILLSGDTLFADGIGRTDLSYSSPLDLQKSLDRISQLPKGTRAYPGHGDGFIL